MSERRQAVLARLRSKHSTKAESSLSSFFTGSTAKKKKSATPKPPAIASAVVAPVESAPAMAVVEDRSENLLAKDYLHDPNDMRSINEKMAATHATCAKAGNLEALLFLHSIGIQPNRSTLTALATDVARKGHVRVLDWFRANGAGIPNTRMCIAAAYRGHYAVLEWAEGVGFDFDSAICEIAASTGHKDMIDLVQKRAQERRAGTCTDPSGKLLFEALSALEWWKDDK